MYLGYVDESGSRGPGSLTYTLGCVLVEDRQWAGAFDDFIAYRRYLRATFGVPVRAEVKAHFLLQNKGPFRKLALSESARFSIYRGFMRLLPKIGLSIFAVVVRKDVMASRGLTQDPRDTAWQYFLQRLERFTSKGGTQILLVHDEGEHATVRKLARRARRAGSAGSAYATGGLPRPLTQLLDDPVAKMSHESYWVQVADLTAYAAFRHVYPPPPRNVQIVPQTMWNEAKGAHFLPVNGLAGGPPAIVVWPR
jgi:hypothetical protein